MSRWHSHLNTASDILSAYSGTEPFSSFIKKYFSGHKKYGSSDRKQISHLCYCYFRLGRAAMDLSREERVLTGLFLCSNESNQSLADLKPIWNEKVKFSVDEKLSFLNYPLSSVFPWKEELSEGINYDEFCRSFFIQPDLFIRIRPNHKESVLKKLDETGVEYEFISPFTVRLPNSFKADQHFEIDKEIVIQDYNSQQIAAFLPFENGKALKIWDCCAGSGGKSIMAYDLNPRIALTVSDIRESVLANLNKRFKQAGIKKYTAAAINLAANQQQAPTLTVGVETSFAASRQPATNNYDLIIADVPCTGSGTWGRTPEQLFFFHEKSIGEFAELQRKIVANAVSQLVPGGQFLYITCSVFKKENEEIAQYLQDELKLKLVTMKSLNGYDKKADTMFVALFK